MNNFWAGHFTASEPTINNRKRLKQIHKFMGGNPSGLSLDIGKKNYISEHLCVTHNTVGDLNRGIKAPSEDYDIITNFEVLNHVQNVGVLLEDCFKLLRRGGVMYLSTPKTGWFNFYHGRGNFAEYKLDRVLGVLKLYGFEIIRYEIHRPYPFYYCFMGFIQPIRWFFPKMILGDVIHHNGAPKAKWIYFGMRPIFKWFFHKYVIIEARKP